MKLKAIQKFAIRFRAGVGAEGARRPRTGRRGFTMVEIALCLGIVAFALVAILGVLPTGFEVQKKNRDDTIINQDALLFLEAIRSGARGFDDLTNHVESISIARRATPATSGPGGSLGTAQLIYTNSPNPGSLYRLTNAQHIVGLLSTPRTLSLGGTSSVSRYLVNSQVSAQVRSITGLAGEKSKQVEEMAFRYQLTVELEPFVAASLPQREGERGPVVYVGDAEDASAAMWLHQNLYELRLTLRWPLFDRGGRWEPGRNRKTFRTLVSGKLEPVRPIRPPHALFFFEPNTFSPTNTLVPLL